MPRNYGQTTTSIWNDGDFTGLNLDEQAVYFMLKFQPEVTAAGTLPLTLRRWARNARNLTADTLEDHIAQLAKRGHLAVDEDTEELLIIKFIKWDGGHGNSKRRPVIEDAAKAIRSPILRAIVARELQQLGLSDMASRVGWDTAADTDSDAASDRESGLDRVVVKKNDHLATPNPQPATSGGAQPPSPIPPDASVGPPSMFCSKHPDGTEEPCGPCGTAKARYKAHLEATVEREAAAKAARRQAIDDCDLCDTNGIRLDPDTGRPCGRCDHDKGPPP